MSPNWRAQWRKTAALSHTVRGGKLRLPALNTRPLATQPGQRQQPLPDTSTPQPLQDCAEEDEEAKTNNQ